MKNIEIKARLENREKAVGVCHSIGAAFQGDIHQIDTYFRVPEGRFKLRASDPGEDYLVYYHRPDISGPKECDYTIAKIDRSLCAILTEAVGVLAVVEKMRALYLWENVRIHLDRVEDLGEFIEFEAVLSDIHGEVDSQAKVDYLMQVFEIKPEHLIEGSYLNLVRLARAHAAKKPEE